MSYFSNPVELPPKTANSKKTLSVLAIVGCGHILAIWAITHFKAPEFKKIQPADTISVKLIQAKTPTQAEEPVKPVQQPIQKKVEPIKPEPIVKKEPVKQQPKPIATPTPKPAPIAKPEPAKPQPTPIAKPEPAKPQPTPIAKPEPAKPQPTPIAKPEPAKPQPTPIAKPEPAKPQPTPIAKPEPVKPEPRLPPKPITVSYGSLAWKREPRPDRERLAQLLKKAKQNNATVTIAFSANEKGQIINASVAKSSGIPDLDTYILGRVKVARLQPYIVNGVATPINTTQNFNLGLKN